MKFTPGGHLNQDIHKFPKCLPLVGHCHNFVCMAQITWMVLNTETSYLLHNQFLLFRRQLKGYFVYTIWLDNKMLYNSYNEYQFTQIVERIIKGEVVEWKLCA